MAKFYNYRQHLFHWSHQTNTTERCIIIQLEFFMVGLAEIVVLMVQQYNFLVGHLVPK